MTQHARQAWLIAIGGFLAAIAVMIGAAAVSGYLIDSADRSVSQH